jgi:uncharacterized membrane protein
MATLTVWKFDTAGGAQGALELLTRLQKEQLIKVTDAAYVTWPEDRKKPKTHELGKFTGGGALGGAFWGFLFGLLFFIPLLGLAIGAAVGGLAGSMVHGGIDEDFIKEVQRQVRPGTSALFVVTADVVVDKVVEPFRETGATLISTNLSSERESRLRDAFAEPETEQAGQPQHA